MKNINRSFICKYFSNWDFKFDFVGYICGIKNIFYKVNFMTVERVDGSSQTTTISTDGSSQGSSSGMGKLKRAIFWCCIDEITGRVKF